jgi:acid phosphatase
MYQKIACVMILCALSAQAQQGAITIKEPTPNLGQLKIRLTQYHDCKEANCYVPQLDRQSDKAIAMLKQRLGKAKPDEKLALVLDIDETSLSNWTNEKRDDYGYIAKDWDSWVKERAATPIQGTLRLYREARNAKVTVFFITGRPENEREDTEANLKSAGYDSWEHLSMRANDHPASQTVTEYKSGERGKIVSEGYHIILNVGDQFSDLNGTPGAEKSIKLPNPFYYIP